jgi:hypothetical protein
MDTSTRQALTKARVTAAQVRLIASKVRMVERAAKAASTGPIGAKKAVALAQAAAAAVGVNSQYIAMLNNIQDREAMLANIEQMKEQAKVEAKGIARRRVMQVIGPTVHDLNQLEATYVELRDTGRELYKLISDIITDCKLLGLGG